MRIVKPNTLYQIGICVWLGFLLPFTSFAKVACGEETLTDAQKVYDEGQLLKVEEVLSRCLNNFSQHAENIRAYKLLILSYIYSDQHEKAKQTMQGLLTIDNEFELTDSDPAEFKNLYYGFRTSPIFSIGVTLGGNMTSASVINTHGLHNTAASNQEKTYSSGFAFQGGIAADFELSKKMELGTGLNYMLSSYTVEVPNMLEHTQLKVTESQSWVSLPITLKYLFSVKSKETKMIKKWRPYVGLGAAPGLLLGATATAERTYINREIAPVEQRDVTLTTNKLRRSFNYTVFAEAGVKWKIKKAFVSVNMRYDLGMMNQVMPDNRYADSQLIFQYGHVDDDFKLNRFSISVSYLYAIYKPKLLSNK